MIPNTELFQQAKDKAEADYQAALRHLKTAERILKVTEMARQQTAKAYDHAAGVKAEPRIKQHRQSKRVSVSKEPPRISGSMVSAMLGV